MTQIALDHVARLDERDGTVHAWAHIDRQRILKEAARLDVIPVTERGPMHGVILGVKDVMSE